MRIGKAVRGISSLAVASALAILIAGCASHDDQQAAQAQAAAVKADAAAARAEESADRALAAANAALRAANEAARKVKEDTEEINRVADHLEQLRKEHEATRLRLRRKSSAESAGPADAAPSASK